MILALLGVIGTVAVVIWRVSVAIQAAREIGDAAEGLANLPRKMRFQSKAKRSGVKIIADAREAATLLLLSVARAGGEVTAEEKAIIRRLMSERFELSEDAADEMLTHVAWLSRELPSADSAVERMTKMIRDTVTEKELTELADMLEHVSRADGDPTPDQLDIIQRYCTQAGV